LKKWSELGVKTASYNSVPRLQDKVSLIVPAGHNGPAFIIYDNFRVIMKWNRSEFYALAVGILADQIKGAGSLVNAPPEVENISISDIKKIQQALKTLGLDVGAVDGIFGGKSKRALRQWQEKNGMVADGFLHEEVLRTLLKLE
jgi:membrane-bound lytic murein transglycosylase B